jgi:hypothetical protein
MPSNENSTRFVRQLLLHRYKMILDKLKSVYNLSDAQMAELREKTLNVQRFVIDRASD